MKPTGAINLQNLIEKPPPSGDRLISWVKKLVTEGSQVEPNTKREATVACRRRPNHKQCDGRIQIVREESESSVIRWNCPCCGDHGHVENWRLKQINVFTLTVDLIGGPVQMNHVAQRRLRVCGETTLQHLHALIEEAFGRHIGEAYEFMIGAPYDKDAMRFTGGGEIYEQDLLLPDEESTVWSCDHTLPSATDFELVDPASVTIESLGLKDGKTFGYLSDFGREWMHRVNVDSIERFDGPNPEPTLLESTGFAPPVATDLDAEFDLDDFDDDHEDTEFPMSMVYGPYSAESGPAADLWLRLEELEALLLVMEAHAKGLPPDHPPVESVTLHALVHCLAETQLAIGDADFTARLRHLQEQGLTRHQAIHRLGEQLASNLLSGDNKADIGRSIVFGISMNRSKNLQN